MAEIEIPKCYYGEMATLKASGSDANPGRRYFGCRKFRARDKDCGYFMWFDPPVDTNRRKVMEGIIRKVREGEEIAESRSSGWGFVFGLIIGFIIGYICCAPSK